MRYMNHILTLNRFGTWANTAFNVPKIRGNWFFAKVPGKYIWYINQILTRNKYGMIKQLFQWRLLKCGLFHFYLFLFNSICFQSLYLSKFYLM